VDAPSASIPAITFVITAILPMRSHQGNQAVVGVAGLLRSKSQIKGRSGSFPSPIASRSQLQQRSWPMLLNGIV
jgi:hypothetical protein